MEETKQERLARLKKAAGISDKTLPMLVMDSDVCDHNPTARMLLLCLALGTRSKADGWVPEDMPDEIKEDIVGWCDRSQWKLALRVGCCESTIQKLVTKLEKMGAIKIRRWVDDNEAEHALYKINREYFEAHQRPDFKRKKDVERPGRYKDGSRKANKGSFSKKNQPLPADFGKEEVVELDD